MSDELVEAVALAILNSDRDMRGLRSLNREAARKAEAVARELVAGGNPGLQYGALENAFAAHREAAEAAERARIVAWIRACSLSSAIPDDPAHIIADLADAIERKEHL